MKTTEPIPQPGIRLAPIMIVGSPYTIFIPTYGIERINVDSDCHCEDCKMTDANDFLISLITVETN